MIKRWAVVFQAAWRAIERTLPRAANENVVHFEVRKCLVDNHFRPGWDAPHSPRVSTASRLPIGDQNALSKSTRLASLRKVRANNDARRGALFESAYAAAPRRAERDQGAR
uniref:Uncharacterized protein n=1 Tax=Coccidioides posadasii RMSCC 3488 TaxID=454284 RepID=A0A0J6F641_COCPO|nr:hypothetical protein CPAG_01979 [Coccidioides posadasii RMSCC 3488]